MTTIQGYYEQYWDRDTDVSDNDCTTPERKTRLLKTLERFVTKGEAVLDLGCGAGKFTSWIKAAGYAAAGMDLSTNALEMAKKNNPDASFALLNSDGSIPAQAESYSAVWTTEVIEHVLDVPFFLREINRVLKPGGLLILTTPYHGVLKNVLISLLKFDKHFNPLGSHVRFFDQRGLDRCLRGSGFMPLSFEGIGRFWKMYRTWYVVAKKIDTATQ